MPGRDEPLRFHAICPVLGDRDLFEASLASIYDFAARITVVTAYDRDWHGRTRIPDETVQNILDRTLDPDRKIDLVVISETNQARAINRVMDLSDPSRRSQSVATMHTNDGPLPKVDYFWIVDSDEIYEARHVPRLFSYVKQHRGRVYQVGAYHYFKTWNHRIDQPEFFTAFVRSDVRLGAIRNPLPGLPSKIAHRIPGLGPRASAAISGIHQIPMDVGLFHHGSYIGPLERVRGKVASSAHAEEMFPNWVEQVWAKWTPETRDFHPLDPPAFHSATSISFDDLPEEIRSRSWPPGYLDHSPDG